MRRITAKYNVRIVIAALEEDRVGNHRKRVTVISIGQKGNYLSGLMTTQRYWGAGLHIDFSAFQFEKTSQTLAEIQFLYNGKHIIAVNFILMAFSNKQTTKKSFSKLNTALLSSTPENPLVVNLRYQEIFSNLYKTENISPLTQPFNFLSSTLRTCQPT